MVISLWLQSFTDTKDEPTIKKKRRQSISSEVQFTIMIDYAYRMALIFRGSLIS